MADSHSQVHEEVLFSYVIFKLHEVFGKRTCFIETHCGDRATLYQTLRIYAKYVVDFKIINGNRNAHIQSGWQCRRNCRSYKITDLQHNILCIQHLIVNIDQIKDSRNTDHEYYSEELVGVLLEVLWLGRRVQDAADQLPLFGCESGGSD